MNAPATRRGFLATAGSLAATLPAIVSGRALGLEKPAAASERLTLGVIGIGPRCTYVLTEMLKFPDVQCVAIADVQASRREKGKQLVDGHYGTSDCRIYDDMRELLARKDIDCVLIATGDRWHGLASMMAAEAGTDIYCEKPCGITIDVCRRIAETVRRTGRIFQAGTQRRSVPNFIKAVELVHAGRLGRLTSLAASVYEPVLKNDWLPAQPTPQREECDWNVWLGIAPWRPFNKEYVDGKWRGYFDFESGARLLDWGAHTVDLCQWAHGSDDTTPVEFEPREAEIVCRYTDGVTLTLDFLKDPFGNRGPDWNTQLGTCPVRVVGEEGWISTGDAGGIDISIKSLESELPETVKRMRGTDAATHARNFFDCVKTRTQPVCNADIMRKSHVASHAAALSWILGRRLRFDPASETFLRDASPDAPQDDEANGLRSRPERDPWG
ncbi:MAG: Gfo/Idh/MocA family protein [Planctomycetaceae bacterium]